MKSTFTTCAAMMLAFSLAPETAWARKKSSYVEPSGDLQSMVTGTIGQKSGVRTANYSGRRGRDCGQSDFAQADMTSNLTPVVGIVVDFITGGSGIGSTVTGIGGGFLASDANRAGETKRWNCFERKVQSQVAGIGTMMGKRLDEQDTKYGEVREEVVALRIEMAELKKNHTNAQYDPITDQSVKVWQPTISEEQAPPAAETPTPDTPVATPEKEPETKKPTAAPQTPFWAPNEKWVEFKPNRVRGPLAQARASLRIVSFQSN